MQLTSHLLPYHIEVIMLCDKKSVFDHLRQLESFGDWQVVDSKTADYEDIFWDTENNDLHATGLTLRTRIVEDTKAHSLEFKGTPFYMHQLITAKKYGYAKFKNMDQIHQSLSCNLACEPMQFLFELRPDLVGFKFFENGRCAVFGESKVFKLKKSQFEVAISFHEYVLRAQKNNSDKSYLIEIQPTYLMGSALHSYIPYWQQIIKDLTEVGWVRSTTGKYQRIPSQWLDKF